MKCLTFRKVCAEVDADDRAVKITLFRGDEGRICGWYVGPLRLFRDGGLDLPYLPKSEQTIASVAVVRALSVANRMDAPLCVIDADDLWTRAWQ